MNKYDELIERAKRFTDTAIVGELIANGVTVQKRGEWINRTRNMKGLIDYRYVCSVCGHSFGNTGAKNFNYCPACGAVML